MRAARRRRAGRRSTRQGLAAVALLLVLFLAGRAAAEPSGGQDAVDELERAYATALEDLFRWCRSTRLNQTADEVAAELLEVDPENERARRWLGYKRRQGAWVAPRRRKDRGDWNRTAKESYPQRRAEQVEAFVDRYWHVYEKLAGAKDERARQRLLAIAIGRWPRDPRFRKARGEVQRNGIWILEESARSDAVSERLRGAAQRLLDVAPLPAETTAPPFVEAFGLDWQYVRRSGGITVVGMTSSFETDRVARHCTVAVKMFQLIFGVETEPPADYTVALGRGGEDFRTVLESLDPPEPIRKQLQGSRGFTLREPDVVFTSMEDLAARQDGAVRATVDMLRERAFGDFGRLGWATEGFGAYLTWLVCGTRLSSPGRLGADTRSGTAHGPSGAYGDDWLANARRLAVAGELPELVYVVSVDQAAMTTQDQLAAYAFAAYLVTGRPGDLRRFLHRTSAGKDTADAAIEVTGMDLPALDARFRRWLRESH